MPHAEALLLVDNQKAQVLKLYVFGQEAMGAHHNVHGADPQSLQILFLFFFRTEAGEDRQVHGEICEALPHGVVVLLGENGRGHEKGHLLAVQHRLEGRAKGHFGFSVAYVGTEQAVHGLRFFHVLFNFFRGFQLTVGFFVLKGRFEILLPGLILGKGVARHVFPLGVEANQILCHFFHAALGFGLGVFPGLGVEAIDLHRRVVGGDVTVNQSHLIHGQKELVAPLVKEADVVSPYALHLQIGGAHKFSDAVHFVNHVIADGEARQIDDVFFLATPLLFLGLAENFGGV